RSKSERSPDARPRATPNVPDANVGADSARAWESSRSSRGIPRFEIEVSRGRARGFLAPGVAPFLPALWRSVRGTMKLRFGWQFTAKPLRICGGLGMAHVYRPLQGQAYLAEHAAINPEIAFATPKHRMLNAFLGLPSPSLVTPKSRVLVAPRLHKPQKIVIRYIVVVDRKLLDRHF